MMNPKRLCYLYYSSSTLFWQTDFPYLFGIGHLYVNCKSVDQQSRHQTTPNYARLAHIKSVFVSKTHLKFKSKSIFFLLFYWFLMPPYQLQIPNIIKLNKFSKERFLKLLQARLFLPLSDNRKFRPRHK